MVSPRGSATILPEAEKTCAIRVAYKLISYIWTYLVLGNKYV
jgi:hypothetical protein